MDDYYYDFENRQHYFDFVKETCKSRDLIVKFSAEWCGPCKKIQDYCVNQFNSFDDKKVMCIEIDIDESTDVFAFLKQKKMIRGVPTLFLYRQGKDNYIPDESVSGTNNVELEYFFSNI
jgi:thiol-disulfide isomerase/thioredoxin